MAAEVARVVAYVCLQLRCCWRRQSLTSRIARPANYDERSAQEIEKGASAPSGKQMEI